METSSRTGFAQIFSRCSKNLSCPKSGGAAAPLAPPARTPMLGVLAARRQGLGETSLAAQRDGRFRRPKFLIRNRDRRKDRSKAKGMICSL